MPNSGFTNEAVGVKYGDMDPFKILCQLAGLQTADQLKFHGVREVPWSRGESVYLIEEEDQYTGHVEEGLGTKNLAAEMMDILSAWERMVKNLKQSHFSSIAQCCVAMIVNDMITLGVFPMTVLMHLAVGDSKWFKNEVRSNALIAGWQLACQTSRCSWGGGETPTLRDVVYPRTVVLSGSGYGRIKPKERLIMKNVQSGDAIVFFESSGIHANGLTPAREIADTLTDGYLTRLSDNSTFGDALLTPTHIYVPIIEDCILEGVEIHYGVNITGHGWKKLMRLEEPFTYAINTLPQPQPIFQFLQKHGNLTDKQAYETFNMGAGFAVYVPHSEIEKVIAIARRHSISAWCSGKIRKQGSRKAVWIQPLDVLYEAEELAIR